jgi:hypothetical protein
MISTNFYMFRHRSAFFRESTNTVDHKSNKKPLTKVKAQRKKLLDLWFFVFVDTLKRALWCRNMWELVFILNYVV